MKLVMLIEKVGIEAHRLRQTILSEMQYLTVTLSITMCLKL